MTITKYKQMLWKTNFYAAISIKKFGFTICLDFYCMTKSGGKMKYQVSEISKENEIVCQNIAYIHKQGIGYELENAKRQQAYADAKVKMEGLVSRVAHLVGMAQSYY